MPIKIAVIGCGYWGPNLIRNLQQIDGVQATFVCDIEQTKLENIKKAYPHIRVTKDYLEIIKNPEIDAVCIATPLATHFEITKAALLNNKDVLVEKPFTLSSKEARELINLTEEKKRILMVDHTFLFTGAVNKIKELIDRGELGKLYYFDSERVNLGLLRSDTNVIWDLATHDLSIIDYLFDQKPITVSAVCSSHICGKEEMAHITLKHQEGFISHIHVSWLSPVKLRKILVGGDKKMILYNDIEPVEKIKIYDRGIDLDPNQITSFTPLYRGGDIIIPKIDQTEALNKVVEHFVECIKERKKPLIDGEAGLRVVKILEAIDKSILEKGREIVII